MSLTLCLACLPEPNLCYLGWGPWLKGGLHCVNLVVSLGCAVQKGYLECMECWVYRCLVGLVGILVGLFGQKH